MSGFIVALLAACGGGDAESLGPTSEVPDDAIVIQVVDDFTGLPVPNVDVVFYEQDDRTIKMLRETDAEGLVSERVGAEATTVTIVHRPTQLQIETFYRLPPGGYTLGLPIRFPTCEPLGTAEVYATGSGNSRAAQLYAGNVRQFIFDDGRGNFGPEFVDLCEGDRSTTGDVVAFVHEESADGRQSVEPYAAARVPAPDSAFDGGNPIVNFVLSENPVRYSWTASGFGATSVSVFGETDVGAFLEIGAYNAQEPARAGDVDVADRVPVARYRYFATRSGEAQDVEGRSVSILARHNRDSVRLEQNFEVDPLDTHVFGLSADSDRIELQTTGNDLVDRVLIFSAINDHRWLFVGPLSNRYAVPDLPTGIENPAHDGNLVSDSDFIIAYLYDEAQAQSYSASLQRIYGPNRENIPVSVRSSEYFSTPSFSTGSTKSRGIRDVLESHQPRTRTPMRTQPIPRRIHGFEAR